MSGRSSKKSKNSRKGSNKSSKSSRKGSKGGRRLSAGAKRWHAHLMKVYRKGKREDSSYTLREAMQDARDTYER